MGWFPGRMLPTRPPDPRPFPTVGLPQRVSRAGVESGADTAGAVGHGLTVLVDMEREPVRAYFR